jgi:hypothetical protein
VFCPTGQIGRHRGPNHGYRPLLDGTQTDVERTSAMGHTRELGDASCLLDGGRQLANLRLCGRPEVGMKTNLAAIRPGKQRRCMVLRHAASSLLKKRPV